MSRADLTLKAARASDALDPLRAFRAEFFDAGGELIYLDGNSLGRLPGQTRSLLNQQINEAWGTRLIRSWNESWIDLPARLAEKLSRILGTAPNELLFCDATSVNLYKLAHAALGAQSPRKEIVTDSLNFPSDLYILQGVLDQFPGAPPLKMVGNQEDLELSVSRLKAELSEQTALLSLSLVTYKSAYLYPLQEMTAAAHAVGALVLWDLSHAAGAVEIDLQSAGVDLAVGCSYKYLNGGPGAPAYLYVREGLQQVLESPIKGWFGAATPFAFQTEFRPAEGIQRFSIGTPPILSMAAIEPGLDLLLAAGMPALRKKSLALQDYLLQLIKKRLGDHGFSPGSPSNPKQRGSHLSLRHSQAGAICQALINPPAGRPVVIPDFRAPDSIRLGLAPLYVSFEDIWQTVDRVVEIMEQQEYQAFRGYLLGVT